MSNEENLTSIKELASQLKSSDALIKKIIKDFEIDTIRSQKKVSLSDESVKIIRDILALRASGKKNNEIKEMFYASRSPESTNNVEEEKATTDEVITEDEAPEPEAEAAKEGNTESNFRKNPKNKRHRRERRPHKDSASDEDQKLPKLTAEELAELQGNRGSKQENDKTLDLSQYLEEEEEHKLDDTIKHLLEDSDDEDLEDLSDADESIEAEEEEEKSSSSRGKVRRRQFSFRYIQRQIANDSKRVNYIKQKLKRGVLSSKERMLLEDSLYHRSKLLNGWIHLLRWVKS